MNSLFRLLNPALNEIKMFRSSNEHSAYDSAYTMAAWIHHSLNVVHPFQRETDKIALLFTVDNMWLSTAGNVKAQQMYLYPGITFR